MRGHTVLTAAGVLLLGACTTRTIVLVPDPDRRADPRPGATPGPSTAAILGVPPGHLPNAGQCRVWIPGTPPGRQPRPRSRSCDGIGAVAPAGSWIVYRPTRDRKLVYVRHVDQRRAGVVIRVQVFDIDTKRLIREEAPESYDRAPDGRPREERPVLQRPDADRPADRPAVERPAERPGEPWLKPDSQRPPDARPPDARPQGNRPPPPPKTRPVAFDVPPGQMPDAGECRIWIPGTPPGRQPKPNSRACFGIAAEAPAGAWILYRPTQDRTVVHVRIVDARRAGTVIGIQVFDIDTRRFVREEHP